MCIRDRLPPSDSDSELGSSIGSSSHPNNVKIKRNEKRINVL